jgi:hypothetical protein
MHCCTCNNWRLQSTQQIRQRLAAVCADLCSVAQLHESVFRRCWERCWQDTCASESRGKWKIWSEVKISVGMCVFSLIYSHSFKCSQPCIVIMSNNNIDNMHTFYVFLFRTYMFRPTWVIFRVPQSQNTLVLKCPIYRYLLVWSDIVFMLKMLKILLTLSVVARTPNNTHTDTQATSDF